MKEFMKTALQHDPKSMGQHSGIAMGLLQFAGTIIDHPENTQRFVSCVMAGADQFDNIGLYDIVKLMIRRWAGKQSVENLDARVIEDCRKICDVMGWMPI